MVYRFIPRLGRRTTLTAFVAGFAVLLGGKFERVNASQLTAEEEIEKLSVCYALATDAIGAGNLQEGKNIYKDCFTEDAVFTVIFPDGVTTVIRPGIDAWAEFVATFFQANGYTVTQHLLGTTNITVNSRTAKMTYYLHGTFKRSDTSIDVVNGNYEDEIVLQTGRWKIRRHTTKLIVYLNLTGDAIGNAING